MGIAAGSIISLLHLTGVGRDLAVRLMEAAETWLRGDGAPKIQLMVRDDNAAAIGFYEAWGLEPQRVMTLGRFLAAP